MHDLTAGFQNYKHENPRWLLLLKVANITNSYYAEIRHGASVNLANFKIVKNKTILPWNLVTVIYSLFMKVVFDFFAFLY